MSWLCVLLCCFWFVFLFFAMNSCCCYFAVVYVVFSPCCFCCGVFLCRRYFVSVDPELQMNCLLAMWLSLVTFFAFVGVFLTHFVILFSWFWQVFYHYYFRRFCKVMLLLTCLILLLAPRVCLLPAWSSLACSVWLFLTWLFAPLVCSPLAYFLLLLDCNLLDWLFLACLLLVFDWLLLTCSSCLLAPSSLATWQQTRTSSRSFLVVVFRCGINVIGIGLFGLNRRFFDWVFW